MCANPDSPIAAPDSQPPVREVSRQLTLRGMLVATAIFGAILGGALRLEAPALFVNCVLAGAAALAWKIGRPSAIGTVLGTLGAQAAVLSGFTYYRDDGDFLLGAATDFLIFMAGILLGAAFLVFFFAGNSGRPGARRNWIAAAICLIVPVSGLLIARPILQNFRQASIAEAQAEHGRRLQAIVAEVTALCARLGDAPIDEGELVRQLGHPLPQVAGHGIFGRDFVSRD